MIDEAIERGAIQRLIQLILGLGGSLGAAGAGAGGGGAPAGGWGTGVQHGGIITRRMGLGRGIFGGEAGAEAVLPLTKGNLSQYGLGRRLGTGHLDH
jgi:hypothetical protein